MSGAFNAGCDSTPKRGPTVQLPPSPYSGGGSAILAIAPLRNESGTSAADELGLTDMLAEQFQTVPGFIVLPTNRTLAAMGALGLGAVDSPAQAMALGQALGADALVIGTITAWDPYDPPRLGLTVALYSRTDRAGAQRPSAVNPAELRRAARDASPAVEWTSAGPSSIVPLMLDASDGATRERVRRYAEGRYDPVSALGWRRYTASMRLFSKFACFEAAERLIDMERSRLAALAPPEPAAPAAGSTPQASATRH